ncbi:unnamed protein product [Lasius platythorax]|uniref:Uncharacterized protein n=1 Tax=Lasius platythorax TaxID=488582 RepID=A0AAV2P159_9HYME
MTRDDRSQRRPVGPAQVTSSTAEKCGAAEEPLSRMCLFAIPINSVHRELRNRMINRHWTTLELVAENCDRISDGTITVYHLTDCDPRVSGSPLIHDAFTLLRYSWNRTCQIEIPPRQVGISRIVRAIRFQGREFRRGCVCGCDFRSRFLVKDFACPVFGQSSPRETKWRARDRAAPVRIDLSHVLRVGALFADWRVRAPRRACTKPIAIAAGRHPTIAA